MHEPLPQLPNRARRAGPVLALAALAVFTTNASAAPDAQPPSAASATPQQAQPTAEELLQQQNFLRWVARYRADAKAAGIDEATLRAAFDDVRYLARVIELDRAQPEHTRSIWDYLDSAVSPQRVAQGQDKLLQFRARLKPLLRAMALRRRSWSRSGGWRASMASRPATRPRSTRSRRWPSMAGAKAGRAPSWLRR